MIIWNYILENSRIISIREFVIIIILYGVIVLNVNNPWIKNKNLEIAYLLGCSFVITMVVLYLLQFNAFLYCLLLILLAFIFWIIYNIKMMGLSAVDINFLNKIRKWCQHIDLVDESIQTTKSTVRKTYQHYEIDEKYHNQRMKIINNFLIRLDSRW